MIETRERTWWPDAPADEPAQITLHDNLVAKLRAILLAGELPTGQRIQEAELCRRFSVSRTPLREALKVMAAEGFVVLRANRGAFVAPLDPNEIQPIFEYKSALERLVGLTAAVRATDEEIAALEAIHVELGFAVANGENEDYTRLNQDFHRFLAQTSRNPFLIQAYESLQQKIWRYRFAVNVRYDRIQNSFAEHEHILIALRARTPLDLAERLENHSRLTGLAMFEMVAGLEQKNEAKPAQPTKRKRA